jgi:hydrogenase maturation protein HypF
MKRRNLTSKYMHKFKVTGLVQGVGFRPYIYNACTTLDLVGYVQNVGDGVVIVVNDEQKLRQILNNILAHMRIDSIVVLPSSEHCNSFSIKESTGSTGAASEIPPDLFLCPDCERELGDPKDRRFGYFFITCTACGPRFTIACASPYDRGTTTMRDFAMCATCREEYTDPKDRRYHAQTIACHDCGPVLSLFENGKQAEGMSSDEIFRRVALSIAEGETVAIKGVGGFHLACAMKEESIARLNKLRGRSHKPYAVMCRDITMARTIAQISDSEESSLISVARPIVIVKKLRNTPDLSAASELDTIGIMLPYTPIHHLLFKHYDKPIVMTSSNLSGEPITSEHNEQFVPMVLSHDRHIKNTADDSVIKIIGEHPLLVRRSRGFVPHSIRLPSGNGKNILALGAEMNNTFALCDSTGRLTMSQHMGNTANVASLDRYRSSITDFLNYANVIPDLIVRDLHPSFNTSLYGADLADRFGIPIISVQHHRAHVYSAALEHQLTDFVGIACDGLGYGDDGNIWGGEIFSNDVRIGHLEEQVQLGGDAAARFPHRMLYGILRKFLSAEEAAIHMQGPFSKEKIHMLEQQLNARFNAPLTTSAGRILDAAAALLQLCRERTYDGRPAMLLEAHSGEPYACTPVIRDGVLMTTPLFQFLIQNLHKDRARLSATIQHYIAEGLFEIAKEEHKPIVWAGGCAYNRIMTTYMIERGVLINKEIPPGDGGISAGQIAAVLMSADAGNNIS